MKATVSLLFLFISLAAVSQNNATIDWNKDLDFIRTELPKNHHNFFMFKTEEDFLHGLTKISEQLNDLSDFEVAVKIQQLIASFGDSHTTLNPFYNRSELLPLGLQWFSDGIWIRVTSKGNEPILGTKLLQIGNVPIDIVVDSLSTLITVDNPASVKKTIPNMLSFVQLLEYFGFYSSDSVTLTLERDGGIMNYTVKPEKINRSDLISVIPDPVPLCYQNIMLPFWSMIQKEDNVFYVQYDKCISREYPPIGFQGDVQKLPSFDAFHKAVIDSIAQHDFDKVIFDIRFNGGGNSEQGTKLVQELSTIGKVNEKGKLYVVIGRETFSSAVMNAMDFKTMTHAIFVGEETSGKPNHLGDVKFLTLPSSGLTLQYSTKYFRQTREDLPSLIPDKIIEPSFNDFKEGRDPVYEWILAQ